MLRKQLTRDFARGQEREAQAHQTPPPRLNRRTDKRADTEQHQRKDKQDQAQQRHGFTLPPNSLADERPNEQNTAPLLIDLCAGLFGWGEAFAQEGYHVIGFDIVRQGRIPTGCQLVIQDVRTVIGAQFPRRPTLIVASPPCDDFSRFDQPWPAVIKNRKQPDLSIWRAAERIAEECDCPLIIENVRGAQKFMGQAAAHFGKQYLWGSVPPILPYTRDHRGRAKESLTSARKAERALIPFILAQHIARVFKP